MENGVGLHAITQRRRYRTVTVTVEDGGRRGAHAHAFLCTLVERAVRQGRRSRAPAREPSGTILRSDGAAKVSFWVKRWHRHISSWLHLSLS